MRLYDEGELVQNPGIGAALLWEFVAAYCKAANNHGPSIPLCFPVIPITFHQETVECLHRRIYDGGLFLAIADNRTLFVDLQERVESMLPQTMMALNFAFASKLLLFDSAIQQIHPGRRTSPFQMQSKEFRRMINTSKRLGHWFGTLNVQQLAGLLRIRF